MTALATRLAFHPRLVSAASEFCAAVTSAFAVRHVPCAVGVSLFPDGPGETSLGLSGPRIAVCVDSTEVLAGPLWDDAAGTCPECLDYWLLTNAVHDFTNAQPAPALDQVVGLITLVEISLGAGTGRVAYSLSRIDGSLARHPVVARRDCPRCGSLASDALPLEAHCSRRTGVVTKVDLTNSPVAGAYRATALWTPPVPVPLARPRLVRQQAYGRGRTREDALRSCLGEALERYTLVYRGDEPSVRAAYDPRICVHPDRIQLFSESQYARRDAWNASTDELFWVPERFDAAVDVDWLPAQRLGGVTEAVLVPAACCLMWYEFRPGEPEFARADTVGCAAGPTLDAAITHGLLEWIERDAMAIWWDNRIQRPAVRLESFDDPDLLAVRDGLAAIGRTLVLLDCTTDIAVPVYVAVAARGDGSEPLLGAAAHPNARTAAYRAASEAGQVWYEANRSRGLSQALRDWLFHESTVTQPYLQAAAFIDAPLSDCVDAGPEICGQIVAQLESVGLRAYVVDQTRTDAVVHTARCIVPGLRHVWNRRAAGRLYDVPVALGWTTCPTAEDQLNPIRCMI